MKSHSEEQKGIVLTVIAILCWGGGMVLSKKIFHYDLIDQDIQIAFR